MRCSDEPWVQLSGVTRPCVSCWIRSSPTAAAASRAAAKSASDGCSRKPVALAWWIQTPAKQSAWSSIGMEEPPGPVGLDAVDESDDAAIVAGVRLLRGVALLRARCGLVSLHPIGRLQQLRRVASQQRDREHQDQTDPAPTSDDRAGAAHAAAATVLDL